MRVKLSQEDCCAIDLVLEHRNGDASADSVSVHCFGKSTASLQKRVKKVEGILDVLSQAEAAEPSAKLVAMTMRHIKRAEQSAPASVEQVSADQASAKAHTISHSMMQRPLQ